MLREKLFPLMKGAFNYLHHHLLTGNDGKFHMKESLSPEYGKTPFEDCNYTLSLLRWLADEEAFSGYSYAAAASMYAMQEKPQQSYKYFRKGIEQTALPNTMYAEGAPVIETPLLVARAMQDMVMQGYKGIIRVFPGVPAVWDDVSFHNFRADGVFLVSAKRANG